ncbi:MAG: hypothetical protein AB8V46_05385, partial [Candidatus Midichloria sp.]
MLNKAVVRALFITSVLSNLKKIPAMVLKKCKHFQQFTYQRSLINPQGQRKRASMMTLSKVITILV